MTGLEGVVLFALLIGSVFGPAAVWLTLTEHNKRRFLVRARRALPGHIDDVESGGVDVPLRFTWTDDHGRRTRFSAVVRGRAPLWHVERLDDDGGDASFAVVERGWRAPDVEALPVVGNLSLRLEVKSDDSRAARAVLERSSGHLFELLERKAQRLVAAPGRTFLELSRSGLEVADVKDALRRLDGIIAVLAGSALPPVPHGDERRVTDPDGAPLALPKWGLP